MVVGVGPTLVGSRLTTVCVVARGPLGLGPVGLEKGIPNMMGGGVTSLISTIPRWKGLGSTLTMVLYGVVNKVGLD